VKIRPLAFGLGAIVVLIAGSFLIVALAQKVITAVIEDGGTRVPPRVPVRELPPEPRLQAEPVEDLRRLRDEEDAVLESYAWIDRSQGIVQIPIERAIELLAVREQGRNE
jgi:hypothetical protein